MSADGIVFRVSDRLAGRAWRRLRARPYLPAALLLHLLAVAALAALPGLGEAERARSAAAAAARTARQIEQTEARQLQQRVARMAAILQHLARAAGDPPPSLAVDADASPEALAGQAQQLADAIDAVQRRLRAAALARLAGLTPAEALREVDARAAATPPPPAAATPADTIARLERQAQEALDAQRAQLQAQQDGVSVRYPADGIQRSLADQLAAMARNGPPQGRVGEPGVEGGRSVNPRKVEGVAGGRIGRPEDTAPGGTVLDLRPPVALPGARLDLTGSAGEGGREPLPLPRAADIDRAALRTGAGRVFGPGGAFANRIYLDSWYLLGPFDADPAAPMATAHPPELGVDLDGVYRGAGGRVLSWHYESRGFYPFVLSEPAERAVYYAYTELRLDEDRDLWLSIAGDDDSMLWLDGRLVWVSPSGARPWHRPPYYLPDEQVASLALTEGQRRVHLARGTHRLLLKLYNDRDRSFFSVVLAP